MRWPVIRPRTGASIGDVRPSTRASYESNIKRHDAGTLSVRQTLIAPAYKLAVSTPKTKKGRRKVALDSATVDALRVHRRKQLEERLAFGGDYPTTLDTFEDL